MKKIKYLYDLKNTSHLNTKLNNDPDSHQHKMYIESSEDFKDACDPRL